MTFTEFSYMTLQAADFLHLHREQGVDLQMGGADQWGNITAGLELIRRVEERDEGAEPSAFALCSPLLLTRDGQKMGKSERGAVFLDPALTSPYEFFQYWLNDDDALIADHLRWLTLMDRDQVEGVLAEQAAHPELRPAQRALALDLTARIHGRDEAERQVKVAAAAFSGEAIDDPEILELLHRQVAGFAVGAKLAKGGRTGVRSCKRPVLFQRGGAPSHRAGRLLDQRSAHRRSGRHDPPGHRARVLARPGGAQATDRRSVDGTGCRGGFLIGRLRNRRGMALVAALTTALSLSAGNLPSFRADFPAAADSELTGAAALLSGVGTVAAGTPSAGSIAALGGHRASGLSIQASDAGVTISQPALNGIDKIKHVVVVMQENRSFDHYFGTFPGVDGISMQNGVPTACIPTGKGGCIRPYHDKGTLDAGGPHHFRDSVVDVHAGAMDGFIKAAFAAKHHQCQTLTDPECTPGTKVPDVMGYKNWHEIPNYWKYARNYVLQDAMFEPVASWSLPAHLFLVSGWSANCPTHDPMSCKNAPYEPKWQHRGLGSEADLRVDRPDVPDAQEPRLVALLRGERDAARLPARERLLHPVRAGSVHALDLEPAPQLRHRQAERSGQEHPVPEAVLQGGREGNAAQGLMDRPQRSQQRAPSGQPHLGRPGLRDRGGQRDHEVAQLVEHRDLPDLGRLGRLLRPRRAAEGRRQRLRHPGAGARHQPLCEAGVIDHQTLSFDAYLKFIEDDFLGGARLDPKTDGRPDPRPTVRENAPELGDLALDFDFSQPPRPPLILNPRPRETPAERRYWQSWLANASPDGPETAVLGSYPGIKRGVAAAHDPQRKFWRPWFAEKDLD